MARITDEVLKEKLQSQLVIPLWPEWGQIMGFSRNCTYEMAAKGLIEGAFQTGRLWRIPTAVVRKKLQIEPAITNAETSKAAQAA